MFAYPNQLHTQPTSVGKSESYYPTNIHIANNIIIIIFGSTALCGPWPSFSSEFATNQFSGFVCQPYANPSYPEGSMVLSLFSPFEVEVEFEVTMRLMVSRPVRLGVLSLLEQVTRCYII
jgi:hypothetical protein